MTCRHSVLFLLYHLRHLKSGLADFYCLKLFHEFWGVSNLVILHSRFQPSHSDRPAYQIFLSRSEFIVDSKDKSDLNLLN